MKTSTKLKSSERRTRKQQQLTSTPVESETYKKICASIKKLEKEQAAKNALIEKKLKPIKISLDIHKIEQQIFDIEDKIDDLKNEKERIENLVIDKLASGKKVPGFYLRIVAKRISISYKSICEFIFKRREEEYQKLKDMFGDRKEQYVLLFQDEEVASQDIT